MRIDITFSNSKIEKYVEVQTVQIHWFSEMQFVRIEGYRKVDKELYPENVDIPLMQVKLLTIYKDNNHASIF